MRTLEIIHDTISVCGVGTSGLPHPGASADSCILFVNIVVGLLISLAPWVMKPKGLPAGLFSGFSQ